MRSTKAANKPGHITTGNVLEDLGFSPEEIREIEIQNDLWVPIRAEIEARKLTQSQLAKVLQIHQPDASLLRRGQLARFSITRMLQFAERLGLAVTINVAPSAQSRKPVSQARIPVRKSSLRKQENKASVAPKSARRSATA